MRCWIDPSPHTSSSARTPFQAADVELVGHGRTGFPSGREILALVLLACSSACGDSSHSPTLEALPIGGASSTIEPRPQAPERAALAGRKLKLPPEIEAFRARLDPRVDGWPSEALASILEHDLRRALTLALDAESQDLSALEQLVEPTLSLRLQFRPAVESVVESSAWAVRRSRVPPGAAATEAARVAPTNARESLRLGVAAMRAVLGEKAVVRVETSLESWAEGETSLLRTEVHARIVASALSDGPRVQINADWRLSWRIDEARKTGIIVDWEIAQHEEVVAPRRAFREVTSALLGAEPFYERELSRGNDATHQREDRLGGQAYLGMHGIAVSDVDGDGREELYVCQPRGTPSRLLRRRTDGTLEDIAPALGLDLLDGSSAALAVDIDSDGDEDFVVASGNRLLVSWNDGHGRFPEGTLLSAPDAPEIYGLAAADTDLDGDIDLYACRYVEGGVNGGVPTPYCEAENGARNLFFRNDGAHAFREASAECGLDTNNSRFSLAAIFEDFDDDGDVDLYVTNDFGNNCLYVNEGGRFSEDALKLGAADRAASMGASAADFDLDGDLDVYVTNMSSSPGARIASQPVFQSAHPETRIAYVRHARGNTLLRSRGDGRFEDVTVEAGAARGGWAWGAVFAELDGDGYADLYVPNGFVTGPRNGDLESFFWRSVVGVSPAVPPAPEAYVNGWAFLRAASLDDGYSWSGHQRNYAYVNTRDGRFADASAALGIDFEDDARSVIALDWDGDHDLDLVIRNRTGPRLRFLRNELGGHGISVLLVGTQCTRAALGATVRVVADGRTQRRSVHASEGYLAGNSRRLQFPLRPGAKVERVSVRWPGGSDESFEGVSNAGHYRLVQGTGRAEPRTVPPEPVYAADPGRDVPLTHEPATRLVLHVRMPIGALPLPRVEGPGARLLDRAERLLDRAERPLVLVIAASGDPLSEELAQRLGAALPAFEAERIDVHLLACEVPRPAGDLVARAPALGYARRIGVADTDWLRLLQVAFIEVLGPFESLPLPLAIVLDARGRMCVVHTGAWRVTDVARDARLVRDMAADSTSTERLTGGHYVSRSVRDLESVAKVYDLLGQVDLARWMRNEARTNH